MSKLTLRQHPAHIRESTKRNDDYPVDYKTFEGILRDFSHLKMSGDLGSPDTDDFKEDLLRNDSPTVIDFIEKSIDIPELHPLVHILLFEVLKSFLENHRIANEKHSVLFVKLLRGHSEYISRRYDFKKVIIKLLGVD